MLLSRRNFFQIAALPVIASLAPDSPVFGQVRRVSDDRLMTLRSGHFRNQIGSEFKLTVGSSVRRAVLTDVEKFQSLNKRRTKEVESDDLKCFSLTFQMSGAHPVEQGTYDVKHGILGDFQLFLVPGALSAEQSSLVAVINRSR